MPLHVEMLSMKMYICICLYKAIDECVTQVRNEKMNESANDIQENCNFVIFLLSL